MNASRKITLVAALTGEDVFNRLATILPRLLRIFVQARVDGRDLASMALPPLLGPKDEGCERSYECTERGTTAWVKLLHNVVGSSSARFVSASILSHGVSRGLFALQLWTNAEPSAELFLKSYEHVIEEQVAAIKSALDVKLVESVFLR